MAAFVIALAVLMWMWSAMGLHLVRWLAGKAGVSVQLAYLAVMLGVGVLLLLALAWFVLPGSVISEGWTRSMLERTQQVSAALVLLVAVAGFWRVWRVLSPPSVVKAPTAKAVKAAAKPAGKEKRRP